MGATTAEIIINALHRRGKTRKELIHEAGIVQSSFEKAMIGARPFPLPMLIRIGGVLGIEFDEVASVRPLSVAPDSLGAYSRAGVRWIEGSYVALSHALRRNGGLRTHALKIGWDEQAGCLLHYHRDDPSGIVYQRGEVSVPSRSGHIFLITNGYGQHEIIILAPPSEDGRLYGLSAGLVHRRGATLPGSGPMVLIPYDAATLPPFPFGIIERSDVAYDRCSRLLADAEANVIHRGGTIE